MDKPFNFKEWVRDSETRVKQIDVETVSQQLSGNSRTPSSPYLIDIRETGEVRSGFVQGSHFVPRGDLEQHVSEHCHPNDHIYLMCQSGSRSVLATECLNRMGYPNVWSIKGGFTAWRDEQLPISSHPKSIRFLEPHDQDSGARSPGDWNRIREEFPIVQRQVPIWGNRITPLLYLDHAASTHPPLCVMNRYFEFIAHEYANIHRGTHLLSRTASNLFDECYGTVAGFIGAELETSSVVFCSNTTQAIDLCSYSMSNIPGDTIVSGMEHHSNDLPHRRHGRVWHARILSDGRLDMDHLEQLLREHSIKLVAITGASNVTGWMPNIHNIARLAHEHGARILVDAAQLLGHAAINVLPIDHPEHLDFVAGAGHKAYAPFGAAFLYGPRHVFDHCEPYIPGGGTAIQVKADSVSYVGAPDRHQGGTPNIGGVIAMAESLRFLQSVGMEPIREHEIRLTTQAIAGLQNIDGITIYGPSDPVEKLGVIALNIHQVSDLLASAILSEECGIASRNGRFCAHPYMNHLLSHQGEGTSEAGTDAGALRVSIGIFNNEADIERLLEGIRLIAEKRWKGSYRVRNDAISTESAGRCNDKWMEPEEN